VDVGLAPANPPALAALVSALYTPGTPEYRHFLSTSVLAERFGPSGSAILAAESYFEQLHLSVQGGPDHLLLTVTGPADRIASAFGTTLEMYRGADGRTFFSHPTEAVLPSVAPWSGVYGLGNVTPLVPAVSSSFGPRSALTPEASCSGVVTALLPCQLWNAYDVSSLISGGTNGSGIRLAPVDAYSSAENQTELGSDLLSFENGYGLSPGPVTYLYPDTPPGDLNVSTNLGWGVEDALDLEWARAMAPGASLEMTFSPDSGPGLYAAVDWLVAHQAANVISLSWGEPDVGVFDAINGPCYFECNASTDGSYGVLSPVLAFAAAEGITVLAASGDCGASDGTSGLSTNFPASDPYVTGVGGTLLNVSATGAYLSEEGWSGNATGATLPGCNNQGGSGGGYSPFPRPAWQTGLPRGTTGRAVPDVAIDGATPADLVKQGEEEAVYGTSLGTVVWAGIAAIADQYAGTSLGFLNPTLYAIAAGTNYSRDLHDVTTGSNGYSAGMGWDPVTGLGSPLVSNLLPDLLHRVPLPTSTLASFVYASPRFGPAPLTVQFHLNVTGGSGSYPLEGVSFGDGNASFAAGGSATYTYSYPGVYSAQGYVADSGGNTSVSPPVVVVVGGGRALSVALTASSRTPAVGSPVTLSVLASGGTSPYEYNFSFGDGTYLDNATVPSTSHVYGAEGGFCAEVVVHDSASPMNGGASARAAIVVGTAPAPDCRNDTAPLVMTPTHAVEVRDAPADFPDLSGELFRVSGGSTAAGTFPPSIQLSSTDPYIAACGCDIFRSAGVYPVSAYASDSENEEATAVGNVTVAPPLVGNFTATPSYGVAPLAVLFRAAASGGDGAHASTTGWTFGDGTEGTGDSVSHTYSVPGLYVAAAHLSDAGHANASEAIVIDVVGPGNGSMSSTPYLRASIDPAVDVPLGSLVSFRAGLVNASGVPIASTVSWTIGAESGGFWPSLNWTYATPLSAGTNGVLNATLVAADTASDRPEGGVPMDLSFRLSGFGAGEAGGFLPRVNALTLVDSAGPENGSAPLNWTGRSNVTAPGGGSVVWDLGNGPNLSFPNVETSFGVGLHTVVLAANDSWSDTATDVFPVTAFAPLGVTTLLSTTSGSAPLTVTFQADAYGGHGPPYLYAWSFGDGGVASGANATHTFDSTGTYTITLNVTDVAGTSTERTWTVTVSTSLGAVAPFLFLGAGAAVGTVVALGAVLARRRSRRGTTTP
jgi:PKD repeat protein